MNKKVLEVENLTVQFKTPSGSHFNAVKNISFDINKGEVIGLVGESGSGKSTTASAILGLVNHSAGSIKIDDEYIPNKTKNIKGRINKWLASKVQMIFQDAKSSLNPRETVYKVIIEGAKNQKIFEAAQIDNKVKLAKSFLTKNDKYKSTRSWKLLYEEIGFMSEMDKIKKEYEKAYSLIFTKFDDQRVIFSGIKMKYITSVNTYKSSYKTYLSMARKTNKDKVKFLKIKEDARLKLRGDLEKLKKNYEDDIKIEKPILESITKKYKEQKKVLKNKFSKDKNKANADYKAIKAKISQMNDSMDSKEFTKIWEEHKLKNKEKTTKKDFYEKLVYDVMKQVSISPEHANRYPGEFSGGQAQRIAIARTLIMDSNLIIADEPISALDVSIQAQVINILKELIRKKHLTVLFIAHDLQVVRYISDRIIVMYKGELVEEGNTDEVYNSPVHPYTKSLLAAVPSIDNPKRIRSSKPYVPEHVESFVNIGEINKKWHKISKTHKVFGTDKQIKKWQGEK